MPGRQLEHQGDAGRGFLEVRELRPCRFGDAEHFTERLLAGQPLAAQFAQATDEQRQAVSDDVNAALEPYGDGEHVAFEMPSLIAVARR